MDLYNLVVSAKLTKGEGGDVDVDSLSVTENGTYTAQSGHAYNPVVVNVPSVTPTGNINITSTAQTDVSAYATAQVVDADLVASNIKKDVDILGVVGTYEGGGGSDDTLKKLIDGSITDITIPAGTQNIRSNIFWGLNFNSVEMPDSLLNIENSAFGGSNSNRVTIKSITCRAVTPPTLNGNALGNTSYTTIQAIYVPAESVETYKNTTGWLTHASKIQAIPE